jgi:phosphoglycerol transferase
VVLASVVGVALVLNLWQADLSVPFSYGMDEYFAGATVKAMTESGWYMHSDFAGAPSSFDLYDFVQTNNLDYLIMKAIALASDNYAFILNVYFLLTFPLIAASAFLVMRKLGLSLPSSAAGSLLFAFMPYHFLRGLPHILLASYFMIPPAVLVTLWLFGDRPPLLKFDGQKKPVLDLRSKRSLISIAICLLVSATYIYYPFFTCMFMIIAGLAASLKYRSLYRLLPAAALVAIVIAGVLVNVSPSLLYWMQNGSNGQVTERSPLDAETYGLKIDQMLLPIEDHRIPFFAGKVDFYTSFAPLVNENAWASLGIVGSLGFIALVLWEIFGKRWLGKGFSEEVMGRLNGLSLLNISAVLMGTIGGFGALVSALVLPQIRCYNRISIFIAFFALIVVFTAVDAIFKRLAAKAGGKKLMPMVLFSAFAVLLIVAGVFDQTSASMIPAYEQNKAMAASDRALAQQIEDALPAGSMVFQLPYVVFPENPRVYNITDYSHFRMYLNSDDIRWSYGAVKGRYDDAWQKDLSYKPADQMVRNLSLAGFDGLYVDGNGYPDGGVAIIAQITAALGYGPSFNDSLGRWFFSLMPYNDRLKSGYTAEQYAALKGAALHPIIVNAVTGFTYTEVNASASWQWGSSSGSMKLINPGDVAKNITITMIVATSYPENATLTFKSGGRTFDYTISSNPGGLNFTVRAEPGTHLITFSCDARRSYQPNDDRILVFKVINLTCTEVA